MQATTKAEVKEPSTQPSTQAASAVRTPENKGKIAEILIKLGLVEEGLKRVEAQTSTGSVEEALKSLEERVSKNIERLNEVARDVNTIAESVLEPMPEAIPFAERVKIQTEETLKRQILLEQDLDETLAIFKNLDETHKKLKERVSNLKQKDSVKIVGEKDKEEIVYPKELFLSDFAKYTANLVLASERPKNLHERVEEECKVLNKHERTLSSNQLAYRTRITETINQIHFLNNQQCIVKDNYIVPAIKNLPQLRNLYTDISNFYQTITKVKHDYQKRTVTETLWPTLEKEFKEIQQQFNELNKLANEYEENVKKTYADIIPIKIEETENSKALFFAYNTDMQDKNVKAWDSMIVEGNGEIERLKSLQMTEWNNIHTKLAEAGCQVDQLGFMSKEKNLSLLKSMITEKPLASIWGIGDVVTHRKLGTYAPVTITPIIP